MAVSCNSFSIHGFSSLWQQFKNHFNDEDDDEVCELHTNSQIDYCVIYIYIYTNSLTHTYPYILYRMFKSNLSGFSFYNIICDANILYGWVDGWMEIRKLSMLLRAMFGF